MTTISLDKINPDFRNAVDLFFFSNRSDIDLSKYRKLLHSSPEHLNYLITLFCNCLNIFFLDSELVWYNKINKLLSLNVKSINKQVSLTIENNFFNALKKKKEISIIHDNEYVQFIQLCRVKYNKKHDLSELKVKLFNIVNYIKLAKVIEIVNYLIPYVYKNFEDFTGSLVKKITSSTKNLDLLIYLETKGIPFDKKLLFDLVEVLLRKNTSSSHKNILAFFALINHEYIVEYIKKIYNRDIKEKILEYFSEADYRDIDVNHLTNIKNVIKLDPDLINDIQIIYANKLYARNTGHIRANADKLIRLLKLIPEANAKKILSYLSSQNKMSDIKYMLKSFPELQKLSIFV